MKIAILINDVIRKALEQTIQLFGEVEFVENAHEAHVVIAEDPKTLAPYYCKEREFIIFRDPVRNDQEAKNVHEFGIMQAMEVMTLPALHAKKGLPENLPESAEAVVSRRIANPDSKRILVVDDTPRHQKSALSMLGEFDLTVATGYDEAMELLAANRYDAVLTDMEMPMSCKGALATYVLGKLIPYGLLIAQEAARLGAQQVALVTDLNHHTDPFSAAFDTLSRNEYVVNGAKVKYMHAPMTQMDGEYVKDWRKAYEILLT